ncbi:putative superoxide dismutase [Rosa chinensis]|uniref:Putative superoxide dismutase n=1 Tax=Rosa chinensis TaxID=74649 RepID=A0A2P6SC60_ROSCH|nr:putative superoxide dismutase [Rosa chinensis]
MQAALAAIVAHSVMLSAHSSPSLFAQIQTRNPCPTIHSAFHSVSLKLPIKSQSQSMSLAAAASPKPLTVVAATKKVVAILKGTSTVEGVVTLTQDDDDTSSCLPHQLLLECFLHGLLFVTLKLVFVTVEGVFNLDLGCSAL